MAMISAHEFGSRRGREGASPAEHLAEALALGVDYVELDVRRTLDGRYVVRHDGRIDIRGASRAVVDITLEELLAAAPETMTYEAALALVQGRGKAHLDFKFASAPDVGEGAVEETWEVQATGRAVDALGADRLVVTTAQDRGVAAVRRWAGSNCPELLVGLTLGGSHREMSWGGRIAARWSELFPASRVERCGANVVVANRWLATLGVARWAARRGLLLVVWTVDDRRALRRWLADPACWMVTTNNLDVALVIRAGRPGCG